MGQKKIVSSASISFIKEYDPLDRSGPRIDPWETSQIIYRKFSDTSWDSMCCFLLLR